VGQADSHLPERGLLNRPLVQREVHFLTPGVGSAYVPGEQFMTHK
jgi:hypothetical protein